MCHHPAFQPTNMGRTVFRPAIMITRASTSSAQPRPGLHLDGSINRHKVLQAALHDSGRWSGSAQMDGGDCPFACGLPVTAAEPRAPLQEAIRKPSNPISGTNSGLQAICYWSHRGRNALADRRWPQSSQCRTRQISYSPTDCRRPQTRASP